MAKKAKSTENQARETVVYIGRSLPGLAQYTVFKNGVFPDFIQKIIAENADVAGLIVPASELQEARKNIKQKGHILNYYAEKLNKKEN